MESHLDIRTLAAWLGFWKAQQVLSLANQRVQFLVS